MDRAKRPSVVEESSVADAGGGIAGIGAVPFVGVCLAGVEKDYFSTGSLKVGTCHASALGSPSLIL